MLHCFCYLYNLSLIPGDYGSETNKSSVIEKSPHTQQSGKYKVIRPTKKRLNTYKPLRSHSPITSEEFDDHTGKLCDDNDLTMHDCDTNQKPQYDIFMESQARLEPDVLGDFLPKLIRSESLKFGNIWFRLFMDIVNFLSVDDARTFWYESQPLVWWHMLLKQHGELIIITCGRLKCLGIMATLSRTYFMALQLWEAGDQLNYMCLVTNIRGFSSCFGYHWEQSTQVLQSAIWWKITETKINWKTFTVSMKNHPNFKWQEEPTST